MTNVAVIVGSLRKDSVNRRFAEALGKLARPKLNFRFVEIGDLPLYNQDLEGALPASVVRFKSEIEAADAVLFVTPEFNRTFPASIKNAIEWGSRPWGKTSWPNKPAAIVGATLGTVGTAAAQFQLRSILTHIGLHVLNDPEVYLNFREDTLTDGEIADEGFKTVLRGWVDNFSNWIARIKPATLTF